jgi:hypothetical protein
VGVDGIGIVRQPAPMPSRSAPLDGSAATRSATEM